EPGPHPPRPEPHPPRPEPGPHPPRPEPRPEPRPRPPHDHPHPPRPGDHHPYRDGHWYRPEHERWGWHDHDRYNKGWDPWFWRQSPNYDRWNPVISMEARRIATLIETGNGREAMYELNRELYDLRYDRYAQNQLLREISDNLRRDRGGWLNLDRWNPNSGTWDTIEIVPPAPPPPPPDQPQPQPPQPEPPIPVPTYDDDPWMKLESTVISSLLDAGDSDAAATRLKSDLYALRGNMDAQNTLLDLVDQNDRKGAGTDLKLGDWNPDTGTYEGIEVLPALTDPGSGTALNIYEKSDAEQPDGVIDTTRSNDSTDPYLHQEIAVVAALIDAGDTKAAATRLVSALQELKGDMESQNELLTQVVGNNYEGGVELRLGEWDPEAGQFKSIEMLPEGAEPGTGIQIKTYPDTAPVKDKPAPAPAPQPEDRPPPPALPVPLDEPDLGGGI
ncbi:MAG: hypothetical protein K2Z81_20460, partial [Cyanobacteria bacterium]|nr:hypothetical protein [Cyanobacteriota bacterium]